MGAVEDVRSVLDALAAQGIEHMLVGGFAQEALGVPRATLDVDIQVALPDPPPLSASTWMGWLIEDRTRDPVFGQDVLIVHVPLGATPFELFVTSHWMTRQALDRRVSARSELLQRDVVVPRREDFILMKAAHMLSPKRSTRKVAQDALDIEAVARAAPEPLDAAYLRENGERLGVWARLAPLLEE